MIQSSLYGFESSLVLPKTGANGRSPDWSKDLLHFDWLEVYSRR